MVQAPHDWPAPGAIDLAIHDLPHASSTTEWWYLNAHLTTVDGRSLSVFASFFRVIKGRDEDTKELLYGHSLTWALSDADAGRYVGESLVDRDAPRLGLEKLDRGEGASDPRLRAAIREILERGNVPYPDRMFAREPTVSTRRLELDFDGRTLTKGDDGRYRLKLYSDYFKAGCDLVFRPQKAPVRHGADGVVRGVDGGDMFYYFVPRCEVTGTVVLNGQDVAVAQGAGWYDHEFGGHREEGADGLSREDVAWNWCAVQLDDGRELTAYDMVDLAKDESLGQRALLIEADGARRELLELRFTPTRAWRSTRTFQDYPTAWRLEVPGLDLDVTLTAAFEDQEFITLISKPAFWEGRVAVAGTLGGRPVAGLGYVERSGFSSLDTLDDFFKAVSKTTRASVASLLPYEPTYEQVRDLVASEERDHYMDGIDLQQFVDTGVKPVREITDRGGKAWRSYAALACCDIVGGDSRDFVHWLAMPELMHVGSLIVDDVQDRSEVRRGGPTVHKIYGEPLAINAGSSCYFMGQHILQSSKVSDATKLRLYDLYFEALRAGHAGQAADLDGLDRFMPEAVKTGDAANLRLRVAAIHRLKTGAPAAALSRMGAVVGGGTDAQVEAVGRYFERVGLAFQIIDDVLNLRGFRGNLKDRGEDIAQGKVTMPIAEAFGRLEGEDRAWLWETVRSKPQDRATIEAVIAKLEACGAIDACEQEANDLVEQAWVELHPHVEDSIPKMMLRAFGWYVLKRHY